MNNYNELIGQLVEYRTETFHPITKRMEPNPVALGIITEVKTDDPNHTKPYVCVEWLVNPHQYLLFLMEEINKFGLTLKENPEWRD